LNSTFQFLSSSPILLRILECLLCWSWKNEEEKEAQEELVLKKL
jgi:hypothetical protein